MFLFYTDDIPEGSSFAAGERLLELSKVSNYFVLSFSYGGTNCIHANTVGVFSIFFFNWVPTLCLRYL